MFSGQVPLLITEVKLCYDWSLLRWVTVIVTERTNLVGKLHFPDIMEMPVWRRRTLNSSSCNGYPSSLDPKFKGGQCVVLATLCPSCASCGLSDVVWSTLNL